MRLTWFDSNSWLIEIGSKRILLDPWLVGELVFSNLPWLFRGKKNNTPSIPENIDLILLSQGLEDHAHPPTLEKLPRDIPVVASPNATKVVEKFGYTSIKTLQHGESFNLDNQIEIKAIPGDPIGPFLIENDYILKDLNTNQSIYYAPHGFHHASIQEYAPISVALTPIIDLNLPPLGPVIQGQKNALQACEWLKPQVIIPTAAGGDVVFDGLLMNFIRESGTVEKFREMLGERHLSTKVLEPKPFTPFELELIN